MSPMWLCILADKQVEDSFENTQWSVLAHFQVPKNCTSVAEIKKKQRQISHANIPPKWGITCLFYAFCSFGWVLKPIFKNRTFSYQSIFLPKEKKQKMETIFNANIHPKWWITFLFFAFTTLGRVLCQFLKIAFKFRLLWSHCLGYTAKKVIWSDDHMSALFLRSAINSFCSC